MSLPPDATLKSHALLVLAREIADACPAELGVEIALAGSVSRGWSDEHSDIELNFWVDELSPWPGDRIEWLGRLGATNIRPDTDQHENRSLWIEFEYKKVAVEAGWHVIGVCEALLRRILAGQVTDMFEGSLTETLYHAVPLRDAGHLRRWQSWLVEYPEDVRRALIDAGLQHWRQWPRWSTLDAAFLFRPEPAPVLLRTDAHIRACLRILFAVNRRWEPDLRKWIRRWCHTLEIKPDGLADRIYAIYEHPLARDSHTEILNLIGETLDLVPREYDAADVQENVALARARWADQLNALQRSVGQ